MNYAHLHLLLNHFPIATLLFGFVILIIGKIRRNESIIRVALSLLVVGGFVGTAAFLTGDQAADVLKSSPTFQEKLVNEHDQAANFGLWATIITACVAAGGLYLSKKKGAVPKGFMIAIFVINFWALTVIARVNYLGGQISHPETRSDSN
jgi:uncharacterized membrane protein